VSLAAVLDPATVGAVARNRIVMPSGVPFPDIVWDPEDRQASFQVSSSVVRYRQVRNRGKGDRTVTLGRANAANAPPLGTIGGRRAFDFSGGGTVMQGPLANSGILDALHDPATNCTVVAMLDVGALGGADQRPLCLTRTGASDGSKGLMFYIQSSNNWRLLVSDGSANVVNASAAASTGKARVAIRKQALSYDVKRNDSSLLSGTAASLVAGNGSNQTYVGGSSTIGSQPWLGRIGRIYIWLSVALDDTQLSAVDADLAAHYGI
jgi:hypothetical protein